MLIRPIAESDELERALTAGDAVLYKHSPHCWQSSRAYRQIQKLAEGEPETPIYIIDVVSQRALSKEIEARLGIRHESPQAILIRGGQVVWHGSHSGIRAKTIAAELAES